MTEPRDSVPQLQAWLQSHTELGAACRIVGVNQPKTGFSADTLMLTVDAGSRGPRDVVVRIEHPDAAVFLDATIARQARMMRTLGRHGVSVPTVLGWEDDPTVIGAPFLVMERCAGTPLPQHPSYHVAGLLIGLDHQGRDRAWREAIETIAKINRIAWRDDFDFLLDPARGDPGLDHYLGWIKAWRGQACGPDHPVIDQAIDYLVEHRPPNMPAELLWGDSNAGNFLFAEDGSVVVAVDFEAASIGPGEIDLAWWFFLERMLSGGNELPEGMPDKAEQIAIYERALGRPVVDLGYFDILAALRMSLVMAQTSRLMIDKGRLDAANRTADFNPAVSMLAALIDVEHDPRMDHYMQFVGAMNQR